MRKAMAAIGLGVGILPCPAFAQSSVLVYGIADAGLEYVSAVRTGGPGTPTESILRLQSGNAASSRFGLRGTEDLGGGMRAVFVLENGFSIDNGTASQGGRLFGRQAYVGLGSNSLGELQLGRETTAIYEFGLQYDLVGPARYSTPIFDAAYVGRADNAVKYRGRFGGLGVTAQYSFGFDGMTANAGEVPGQFRVGKEIGAYVDYQQGPFSFGAAYDRQNGSTVATASDKSERLAGGAVLDLDSVRFFAGYQYQRVTAQATKSATRFFWLGIRYAVSPALTISPAVYIYDPAGGDNRSLMATILASYAFSKRTDLYAQIAIMDSQRRATIGLGGPVNPGDNQFGMTIGVRHRF